VAFYRKLINHLIKHNALKRLNEVHIESLHASDLLTDTHWQLFEDASYKKSYLSHSPSGATVVVLKKSRAAF